MDNFIYPFLFNGPCFHSKTSKAGQEGQGNNSCYNCEEKPKPQFHPKVENSSNDSIIFIFFKFRTQ